MENQLKCFKILPLKEIALRRVAAHLWSDSNILASISKSGVSGMRTERSRNYWRVVIEERIKDKVSKLEVPNMLKKQINEALRPIGLEIQRWKYFNEFHLRYEEGSVPESTKLFWTTEGLIDYQKTAEELVRCDALDVVNRYQLACLNCLEDEIPLIWEKLPEKNKRDFLPAMRKQLFDNFYWCVPLNPYFLIDPCFPLEPREQRFNLTFYWCAITTGELSELDFLWTDCAIHFSSFYQWAFEYFAVSGNKAATKYFFQKLTDKERQTSLMRTVKYLLRKRDLLSESRFLLFCKEEISSIVCYLFTLMTPEQQMEIIRAYPVAVFLRFLFYPWQSLFLENSDLLWTYVPVKGYGELITTMCHHYPILGFSFPKLFQNFFVQSPVEFKRYCIDQNDGRLFLDFFLDKFLSSVDSDSIKVLFRSLNALDRRKLASRPNIANIFSFCILRNGWHLVETCLQEAMLSVEDKKKLKGFFKRFLEVIPVVSDETVNQKFESCFEFLDKTDAEADDQKKAQKRKLENCTSE